MIVVGMPRYISKVTNEIEYSDIGEAYLTYLEPSGVSKSTVLTGATTINGILCLAASTAAL